jgi:hypothetical protein
MFSSNATQVASTAANYIEDVFSTWLYTGNNSTLAINNGIDVSGKGGLVWIKNRQQSSYYHTLVDTVRGPSNQLYSNATDAQYTATGLDVTAFTSTGFTLGPDSFCNQNNGQNVSWTFAKQPKFFDVVTWTGDGTGNRTIPHNLGSAPGSIIVKVTNGTDDWNVWHRSVDAGGFLRLNTTSGTLGAGGYACFGATQNSTFITTGSNAGYINTNGGTYVAYLFAHDAGGFGLTGADNVISCGSFTTDGSGIIPTVNIGYEPQWLMFKSATSADSWYIADNMRGWYNQTSQQFNGLRANLSNAEVNGFSGPIITPTGFTGSSANFGASNTFIYIAIRRGPMKVPTDATKVFAPVSIASAAGTPVTTGFTVDLILNGTNTTTDSSNYGFYDRLRGIPSISSGNSTGSISSSTAAEVAYPIVRNANNVGFQVGSYNGTNQQILHSFGRAPSFFDEVCYTGSGTATANQAHNLGVVPEMIICKRRDSTSSWPTFHKNSAFENLRLNTTAAASGGGLYVYSASSATFQVATSGGGGDTAAYTNDSGGTYVAYLFASCPGVSKVGSYTGNGSTQTIDCGFAGGARFVLIKRSDAASGWYVYDTARGMTALTDPYLFLNSTAAEVATLGSVTTVSTGFALNAAVLAAINVNGGSYIFLAIA